MTLTDTFIFIDAWRSSKKEQADNELFKLKIHRLNTYYNADSNRFPKLKSPEDLYYLIGDDDEPNRENKISTSKKLMEDKAFDNFKFE